MADSLQIRELQEELYKWIEEKDHIIKELNDLADNLDEHFERISKAKIGGSAAGIVGGVLATIGFGLSFVTFGASLGLSIAGGIIAGAGGLTVGGSVATDAVLSRNRRKEAETAVETYNTRVENLQKRCIEIGIVLGHYGNIDKCFPSWVHFWAKLIIGGIGTSVKSVGWDMIASTVLKSVRIAAYFDDFVLSGARAGANAFKTIGSTAGRGLHIAGGVFGVLLMPLDIYTLVDAAIDVHKKNPHKVSNGIREISKKIEIDCPSKEEVDVMINDTLGAITK